MNYMYKEL